MSHQPDDVTDLPSYFRGVEEQFEKIKIPLKYQARLIFRYLSPRARTLCSRLEPDTRDDYPSLKNAVLKEYDLTAKCFLEKFKTLKKAVNDTNILFSSKLRGLLLQYFTERKVDNYQDVVSLLVSDRIKSTLSDQCLKYVLTIENNLPKEEQQWLPPQRLAEVVDEYLSYVGPVGGTRSYVRQYQHQSQPQWRPQQQQQQQRYFNRSDAPMSSGSNSQKFAGYRPPTQNEVKGFTRPSFQFKSETQAKPKFAPQKVNAIAVARNNQDQNDGKTQSSMSTGQASVNKVTIERKRSDIRPWLSRSNCKQRPMRSGNPIQQSLAQRAAGQNTATSQHAASQTTTADQSRAIFSRADCSSAGSENEVTARPIATSTASGNAACADTSVQFSCLLYTSPSPRDS